MKFSYRVVLLFALGFFAAVIFVSWLTTYDRNRLRTLLQEIKSEKPYTQRRPTNKSVRWEATYIHQVTEERTRNETRKKNDASKFKFYETKTDFNTLDILIELNSDVRLHDKMTVGSPQRSRNPVIDREADHARKRLRVIVVPHSHNDPGWHKTVDSYFDDQTKHILNNMVDKLLKYPKMTFIWAESVFLSLWWKDLDKDMRNGVLQLIKRRQLEIVGGGWVVTDEANCHYSSIVDQMIEGHRWLRENIGIVPRNSWSLDPFGYSSFHPYLYKRVGFENAVMLRVNRNVKSRLQDEKALEFFWRQIWDRKNETDMFTLMMPYMLYNIKHSCGPDQDVCLKFDFRQISGEISESKAEPIHAGNIDRQAKLLLGQYLKKAALFRHGVVLIPLGDDFRYDRSIEWDQQFKNYMALFNHINAKEVWNIDIRFGTLQDYFDEVAKVLAESKTNPEDFFPSLSGDFFPYTDHSDEYWTGYFATRPFNKALGRELEVYLRAAELLNTLCLAQSSQMTGAAYDGQENLGQLDLARQHLALFQHHDGITGTCTVWVAQDYEHRLFQGLHLARNVINSTISFLLSSKVKAPVAIRVLDSLNERTVSPAFQQMIRLKENGIRLVVFNPVARQRQELVQVMVNEELVEVIDNQGSVVTSQLSPSDHEKPSAGFKLSFLADLPALGISTFDLIPTFSPRNSHVAKATLFSDHMIRQQASNDIATIENELLQANISLQRGQLFSLGFKQDEVKVSANLKFLFYTSRRSGAYIFAPQGPASSTNFTRPRQVTLIVGPVFSEVRIEHSCVTQVLRLVNCSGSAGSVLQVENIVRMTSGEYDEQELIMRFDSSVKSRDVFYTDQNGYHTMKRRRLVNFPIEANYYPASSAVYIEDKKLRLSIVTAQPVGVSSLKQGSIEVMLDRRLKYDDSRGLGAGVQDNKVVLSRFYIFPEKVFDATPDDADLLSLPTMMSNVLVDTIRNYPIVTVSNYRGKLPTVSLIKSPLPCDVLLVNLKSFINASNSAAMILHKQGYSSKHQSLGSANECAQIGTNVSLVGLFSKMKVQNAFESSLSFIRRKEKLNLQEPLKLDPMELYAYEILYK